MPKYVCIRKCFIGIGDKKARLFRPGEVYEFEDAPEDFFRCLSGKKAELGDPGDASIEELMAGPYKIAELRAYAAENYDVKLRGTSKEDVVDSFVDARFRYLEDHETDGII